MGNPSNKCSETFRVSANMSVDGLPDSVTFKEGDFSLIIKDLSCLKTGDLVIKIVNTDGNVACRTNPMRVVEKCATAILGRPAWPIRGDHRYQFGPGLL